MNVPKILRRIVESSQSVHSNDSGCEMDVNAGIHLFNEGGVGTMIQDLFSGANFENTTITIVDTGVQRERPGSSSSSSSSSSESSSDDSHKDCVDGITIGTKKDKPTKHAGVKVISVAIGSFLNGLGLRKDDVIMTVNDERVEHCETAAFLINRVIEKNVNLALEIQRKETGWIRLENGGEKINLVDVFSTDDYYCISMQPITYRLKHIKYKKYLTVVDDKLALSTFRTKVSLTYFEVYQYKRYSGEGGTTIVRIQQKDTNKCIAVENNGLVLKPAPTGKKLEVDSGLLFKVAFHKKQPHDRAVQFEDMVSEDLAIGFSSKRRPGTLLPKNEFKVLFNMYDQKTS